MLSNLSPQRYLPNRPLPYYRHLPGQTPHPIKSIQGHSYALKTNDVDTPLSIENYYQHDTYLWGIDLFNHAYWWEAHEAWEGPWKLATELVATFLQGLIQISATLLKWHQGQSQGQHKLYRKGKNKFLHVIDQNPTSIYMGLDLVVFLDRLELCLALPPKSCPQMSPVLIRLEL